MLATQQRNPFAPPAPPPAPMDVAAALETEPPPEVDELVAQLLAGGAEEASAGEDNPLEPRRPGGPGRMPGSPNKRKVLAYSHKALADAMILNPNLTGKQLASIFGRTPQWVYLVKSSDAFQAYLERRQGELVDPTLRTSLEERAKALALRSMEVMAEKLDRPIDAIPDQFALRAFELTSKAAALGGNAVPQVPNAAESLPELAARLVALRGQVFQPVIDVPAREVPAPAQPA